MVEWKLGAFDILVSAVDEIVDGECIRFVHVLGASDCLEHGTDDDVRIDDCQVERGLAVGDELPSRFFGQLFGRNVAQDGAFRLNRRLGSDLRIEISITRLDWELHGFPCKRLRGSSPLRYSRDLRIPCR